MSAPQIGGKRGGTGQLTAAAAPGATPNPSHPTGIRLTDTMQEMLAGQQTAARNMREQIAHAHIALKKQAEVLRLRDIHLPPEVSRALDRLENSLISYERSLGRENPEMEQLRALSKTYALINSSLDLNTVLSQALAEIVRITGAARGFIVLQDAQTRALEFRTVHGVDPNQFDSGLLNTRDMDEATLMATLAGVSRTIMRQVLNTRQPILTDNAATDVKLGHNETALRHDLRAVLCVPLRVAVNVAASNGTEDAHENGVSAGETSAVPGVSGVIYVDNKHRPGIFGRRELNLLVAFANQTSVAIENALLFARVQATLAEIARVNELMENVFASIASGVVTVDERQRVTQFNPAAGRILALSAERAVGQPMGVVLPLNHEIAEAITRAREAGESVSIETRALIPARGDQATLGVRLSPLQTLQTSGKGTATEPAPNTPAQASPAPAFDPDATQNETMPAVDVGNLLPANLRAPGENADADEPTTGLAFVIDDLTEQREREQSLDMMRRYLPPGLIENIHQIANIALGGERAEVTCAYILTSPYAALTRDSRPQAMMAALNTYLDVATEIIHRANGVIDKYIGNEIMVLFNTPLNPDSDHALHALQMALDLRRAYTDLYARLGLDPDQPGYTIGLHTGIATLGNVGSDTRRSYTALGDTINLSKRIHDSTQPGEIKCTGETYDHAVRSLTGGRGVIGPVVTFSTLPPQAFRGRQQETRLYLAYESSPISAGAWIDGQALPDVRFP